MEFAPVIIPTLNRDEHLKRCLDSLAKNQLASQTDVYVSVDYPPNSKYVDGYNRVVKLLEEYDKTKFSSLHIFLQEENLGPVRNIDFLKEKIKYQYSNYIFSEDDNEFSENFLEYMNVCMDEFLHKEDVIAICAQKDTNWKSDGYNIIASKLLAAYGLGMSLKDEERLMQQVQNELLDKSNWKFKNLKKLYKSNRCLYSMYLLDIIGKEKSMFWVENGKIRFCDTVFSIYMHLTDKICIVPEKNKARTWGNDGSGVNMEMNDIDVTITHPLDLDEHFSCKGETPSYIYENLRLGSEYMESAVTTKRVVKAHMVSLLLTLCRYNRQKLIKILAKKR